MARHEPNRANHGDVDLEVSLNASDDIQNEMLSTPKAKGGLFLASSLCDGLEDNNMRQLATLLLNKDADPNVLIPTHGVTPFHLVIGNDSEEFAEEVTKLFLRHGGNPNVRSNDGMTPVHVAAAWGRTNILELLLANGGDPLCLDNDGRSPFHYAFDGKYFKVMTLLSKYCENMQDKDDKPKYNMVLDKVLISNGDIIAEYVASENAPDMDVNDVTRKFVYKDDYNSKSTSCSMDTGNIPNICHNTESGRKLSDTVNEHPFKINDATTAEILNNLSQIDDKTTSSCSFIDLDFDFANLHLADVQKEKYFVNEIINHLSTSLASDCSINETLNSYKKIKQKESSVATTEPDTSFHVKKDVSFYESDCHDNSNISLSELRNICTPIVKRWSKHGTQSTCKKKNKKTLDKTSTCSLDNSIVSMSPNFNTPNHRKRRNIVKTPLKTSHIFNDSVISKSPNFATPARAYKKRKDKASYVDEQFLSKVSKKSDEYENHYIEFNQRKKHIAQSTPRRKKRSIYKLYSVRKRFEPYWHESDIMSDTFTANSSTTTTATANSLKPVNLNKTIFSAENSIYHGTIDSYSEYPSLYLEESSQITRHDYNNQLAMQLDEGKYNEDSVMHDNLNNLDKMNLSNSFSQTEKENKFADNFENDKRYAKSENDEINAESVIAGRDIFKTNKASEMVDASVSNVKSVPDSSQTENRDCIDSDTKQLLNEDLNMNINRICKHEKNCCDNKFHENLSYKTNVDNNLLAIESGKERGKEVHLSDFRRSCSLRTISDSSNFKRRESLYQAKDLGLNMCKIGDSSSLISYISTQEEYRYEDPEEGVTLLKRRLCVTPFSSFSDGGCDVRSEMITSDASSTKSTQNLPKELLIMDDAALRKELEQLGAQPGPITHTTRQVYLKRLMRLRNIQDNNVPRNLSKVSAVSSDQIKSHLQLGDWLNHLDSYKSLEKEIFQAFASPDPTRRWREGTSKTSFTYLLLDSRVTQDLPNRCTGLTESETWSTFLNAIFYIGKGKRSRPFAHLYDAFNTWVGKSAVTNKKINRILDIWNSDHGVICLHIFQNIIPVEAYTREALMIDAIGKKQLENCKAGDYYGIAATWSIQQKQKFGRYLLYKALQILMHEGESQLFPCNL